MPREIEQPEQREYPYVSEGFRYIQSWDEVELPPEVDTPEKRYAAAVNIIQNSAQALTVITMPANRTYLGYHRVNRRLTEVIGEQIVRRSITQRVLAGTLRENGVVERTVSGDKLWALTEFGVGMRPAAIFALVTLDKLGLDPMDVFGTRTGRRVDPESDIRVSPALTRATILSALHERGTLREADLMEATGLAGTPVKHHLQALKGKPSEDIGTMDPYPKALVAYEAVSSDYGEAITFYTASKEQLASIDTWPMEGRVHSRTGSVMHNIAATEMAKKAVNALTDEGSPLTIPGLRKWVRQNSPNPSHARPRLIEDILGYWTREGILQRSDFREDVKSAASLTALGERIIIDLLQPLQRWSNDPKSVDEIKQIALSLESGDSFGSLLKAAARRFVERTPGKNSNPEAKTEIAHSLIRRFSGGITRADLAKVMGVNESSVLRYVNQLIADGVISEMPAEHGTKIYLVANAE